MRHLNRRIRLTSVARVVMDPLKNSRPNLYICRGSSVSMWVFISLDLACHDTKNVYRLRKPTSIFKRPQGASIVYVRCFCAALAHMSAILRLGSPS